jgi:hypothetical protein
MHGQGPVTSELCRSHFGYIRAQVKKCTGREIRDKMKNQKKKKVKGRRMNKTEKRKTKESKTKKE